MIEVTVSTMIIVFLVALVIGLILGVSISKPNGRY